MPSKKKAAASPKKKAAPKKPAKPGFGAKAEFIRANPTLTANEVVAKAAESNLTMTSNHVYSVRSSGKAKKTKAAPKSKGSTTITKVAKPRGRPRKDVASTENGLAGQLRTAIARIGLDEARKILEEVSAAFDGR